MKNWKKPLVITLSANDLSHKIQARAWSVQSAMELGALYDQGNMNYDGLVRLPDYGYEVQANVIGYVCQFGYFVYKITYGGSTRYYRQAPDGRTWYPTNI